ADRGHEIVQQLGHDGVEALRPVEGEETDAVAALLRQDGSGHVSLLSAAGLRRTRRVLPSLRGSAPKGSSVTRAVTPRARFISAATSVARPLGAAVTRCASSASTGRAS